MRIAYGSTFAADHAWMDKNNLCAETLSDCDFKAWFNKQPAASLSALPRADDVIVAYTDGGEREGNGGWGFVQLQPGTQDREHRLV